MDRATSTVLAAVGDSPVPRSGELVPALLEAEKQARDDKPSYQFATLLGNWDLRFITGTKVKLGDRGLFGAGWYVPRWAKLRIIFSQDPARDLPDGLDAGIIENQVDLGAMSLCLRGPCKFWSAKRLLAFDFTRARVRLLGRSVYDGFIGKGEAKEAAFDREPVGKLAFFAYFVMEGGALAARGRGGGIAIWSKNEQ